MVKAIKSSLATAQGVKTRFETEKLFQKCINAVIRLDKLAWQHRNCHSALWLVIDFSPEIGSLDHVIALRRPLINIIRPNSQLTIHRQNETDFMFESWPPWNTLTLARRCFKIIVRFNLSIVSTDNFCFVTKSTMFSNIEIFPLHILYLFYKSFFF